MNTNYIEPLPIARGEKTGRIWDTQLLAAEYWPHLKAGSSSLLRKQGRSINSSLQPLQIRGLQKENPGCPCVE